MIRVSLILALLLCLVLCAYGSSDNLKSLSPQMTMRQNRVRRRRLRRAFGSFRALNRRQRRRRRIRRRRCRAIANNQFRTINGYCNNLRRPAQGSADQPFITLTTPLRRPFNPKLSPNPRFISNQVHNEEAQVPNSRSLSELVTFFGQLIDHTVTFIPVNTQEPANIKIPMPDPIFTETQYIPFFRTEKRNDRPLNELTSYIDAASVYGVSEEQSRDLRTGSNGLLPNGLLDLPRNFLPRNDNGTQFVAGDERANENGNLITMHTIWAREHNRVAREIRRAFGSSLNGEGIFQLARHTVIAEMQAVVYYEFLPALTGKGSLPPFRRYNRNVRAGMTNEFSTVGFRVGHTLLNSQVTAIRANGRRDAIPLRDSFFNVTQFERQGLTNLLRGMIRTKASEIDCGITSEVRNFLVDEEGREQLDLPALNIQRGRDHGVPVCNTVRRRFGLAPLRSFADITKDRTSRTNLRVAYGRGNAGNVDAWTCGVCEDHVTGSSLGPLFQAIVLDQFRRLRDGDRFYFENPGYFKPSQIRRVATIRRLVRGRGNRIGQIMRLIIAQNSGLRLSDIPLNPFVVS